MRVGGQRHAPAALPPGKTRYPLYRRPDGPHGRCGRMRKISPPRGFDPQTEEVLGTNVKLSKCLNCRQGPKNVAALLGLSYTHASTRIYICVYLSHKLQTVIVPVTNIFSQKTDPTDAKIVPKQTKRWAVCKDVCERGELQNLYVVGPWLEPSVCRMWSQNVTARREALNDGRLWRLDCLTVSRAALATRNYLCDRCTPRNYDNLFFTHFVLTYDFSLTIFIMPQL